MIRTVHATETAAAIAALREDGVVVLRDAVALAHVAALRDRLLADLPQVLARADRPFNFNAGNVQQSAPRERELLFADVLLNEHAIAVTSALLPGVANTLYSGNTALPGTERQPVHGDSCHLWNEPSTPMHGIVVNVPLVDMDERNGATELWPGTHRIPFAVTGQDICVPVHLVEERRREVPPEQPAVAAGSLVLRDMRLWHAGMPNRTAVPRPMLAMVHQVGWLPAWEKPAFLAATRDFFAHPVLKTDAEWVSDVDHNRLDHAYAFAG